MTDPEPSNEEIFNAAMAAMDRMVRIGPGLFRYVWKGEGVHVPDSADALLGLIKVEVIFEKTNDGEPAWETPERYEEVLRAILGAVEPEFGKMTRSMFPPYIPNTSVMVRYWMSDVPGYRDVHYKVLMAGAGANPEQVRGLAGGP
jgi:hypothetical protein